MSTKSIVEVTAAIVAELAPLTSEERSRAVRAALVLLGDDAAPTPPSPQPAASNQISGTTSYPATMSEKGGLWCKQNEVTAAELEELFHFSADNVELINTTFGKSGGKKVLNIYLLTGLAAYLKSGDPTFSDENARANCSAAGTLDPKNHATYVKAKGNSFTGNQKDGWVLTGPGLKRAALIVKEIAKGTA